MTTPDGDPVDRHDTGDAIAWNAPDPDPVPVTPDSEQWVEPDPAATALDGPDDEGPR